LCFLICLTLLVRKSESPDAGTPAGTVVVRAADLRVRGGETVMAGNAVPSAGELAVFCRPVVTAPAVVRWDGRVLADGWLPDFVRLGELERHLGDGAIEAATAAALEAGRLKRRERRRIMSYLLIIQLMLAMALLAGMTVCAAAVSGSHPCLASTLPARGPAAGPRSR